MNDIRLTDKLSQNNYDWVINIGVAVSFKSNFNIGDVVEVIDDEISELGYEDGLNFFQFTQFDIKCKFNNQSRTQLPKVKAITVNTVHGNQKSIDNVVKKFNPDIESMEGAVVFQVCEYFNVKCMQIRSISNKVEARNKLNWNLPLAIQNLNKEVEKIIKSI